MSRKDAKSQRGPQFEVYAPWRLCAKNVVTIEVVLNGLLPLQINLKLGMVMKRVFFFMFCSFFYVFFASLAVADEGDFGTVSGRLVQTDGTPQVEAVFLLFNSQTGPPPAPGQYFRFPDGSVFVNDEGEFQLSMPPGEYWYGVTKILAEGKRMHPEFSDWLHLSRSGEGLYSLKIEKDQKTEIGELICTTSLPEVVAGELTAIELTGIIRDQTQTPLTNFFVELYSQSPGLSGPLFTSAMTASDGRYAIKIAPGEYSLKLRRISGPNSNGFRNKDAEKYIMPKPLKLSAVADNTVIDRDFVVQDKSKIRSKRPN